MKKIMSILLASAISASCTIPAFAATFADVNENNYAWAYDYVEEMAEKGLISGYEDGTFKPGKSVSRMEAFALFARLLGSNNEQNADIVSAAKEKYADVLSKYSLSYAEGDVAFMLSRGIIGTDELDTYFKDTKKSEPMPRYEAAILITKAMASEEDAKSEVLVDMDYTDVGDIPKTARQYVYFVTKKGIMNGMGDGTFSPDTAVLRGQIAVMLSRTSDSVNYSFETVQIAGIDVSAKNIGIRDADGKIDTIGYTKKTKFIKDGSEIAASELKIGQSVILTYSEDDSGVKLAFADVIAAAVDSTVTGSFQGYASQGGNLSVTLTDPKTGKNTVYSCSSAVSVTKDGALTDINKLVNGDHVSLGMAGDKVVAIETMPKTETIKNVTLESITPLGDITVSSADAEYDGKTYSLSGSAYIYKNGNTADFSALYRGDSLSLTLEYGVVARITATSKKSDISGVIKSYTISTNPTLTIKKDGEEYTYDIPADVEITINGEKARLADFEIGSSVTLNIESDVVKKISAATAGGVSAASSLTGTVTAVNASAKVIIISYAEGGSATTAYVTCTNSTKYYVIPTLQECSLKDIHEGDTIIAYGAYSNGIFISSGVTVTPSVK